MQGLEGLEIKASPTAGKGLFTTKVFAPGDVVMDLERLLLAIPDPARAHDTCAWCFNWTGLPMLFAVGEDEGRIGDVKETHSWCTGCRAVGALVVVTENGRDMVADGGGHRWRTVAK